MRLGIAVTNFSWPGPPEAVGGRVGTMARLADEAGLDSFWAMDHFFQIPINGPVEAPMLELYSTLSFVAGQTTRIRLGSLVTGVAYRHPGVLIKTVTTLDVLSGGRAILGIGASWSANEAQGLGIPFPPLGERFEQLEEVLVIARQMWSGDESPYTGRHFTLDRPLNSPNTLQRPGPPILIGGSGERRTLRLVAKYADACNLFDIPGATGVMRHKLAVLRDHCAAEGRPYEEIEKTTFGQVRLSRNGQDGTVTPAAALDHFHELAAEGIDHAIVETPHAWTEDQFELLAEIAADVQRIVPAGR